MFFLGIPASPSLSNLSKSASKNRSLNCDISASRSQFRLIFCANSPGWATAWDKVGRINFCNGRKFGSAPLARDYSTGGKSKVGIFRIVWEGEMGIFGITRRRKKRILYSLRSGETWNWIIKQDMDIEEKLPYPIMWLLLCNQLILQYSTNNDTTLN